MQIHIRNARCNENRPALLPERTLGVLKDFWKVNSDEFVKN